MGGAQVRWTQEVGEGQTMSDYYCPECGWEGEHIQYIEDQDGNYIVYYCHNCEEHFFKEVESES